MGNDQQSTGRVAVDITHPAQHWDGSTWSSRDEHVVAEAPLQILVNGERFATTMRTPGDDENLVRGLLFTEGIIPNIEDAAASRFDLGSDPESHYVASVDVHVRPEAIEVPVADVRSGLMSAACGVCGTRDAARLAIYGTPIHMHAASAIAPNDVAAMFECMRERQAIFATTGGCHAAAAFDGAGAALGCFEDVGRHNAVDKVVGHLIATNTLDDARVMTVSGRASYEMVYKTYRAGIACLCAVSAPSSMAIECAQRFGITLIGFCRNGKATAYTHTERLGNV